MSGFGLLSDGTGFALPTVHPYPLSQLSTPADFLDVSAFVMCADTGMPPAAGTSRTFTAQNAGDATMLADLAVIEQRAADNISEVVAQGVIGGKRRSCYQQPGTFLYAPDSLGEPWVTRAALLAALGPNDAITFLGMPYGRGPRVGGDRNYSGVLDRDEPRPTLVVSRSGSQARLRWPSLHQDWVLQSAPAPNGPWETVTHERMTIGSDLAVDDPILTPARYYRLCRTW